MTCSTMTRYKLNAKYNVSTYIFKSHPKSFTCLTLLFLCETCYTEYVCIGGNLFIMSKFLMVLETFLTEEIVYF